VKLPLVWEIQGLLAGAQAIVRNAIEDTNSNEHDRCQHIENCINVAQQKLTDLENAVAEMDTD
jgi:hypothetical protein